MALFIKSYHSLGYYRCPCCQKPINDNNREHWVETYTQFISGLGTNNRGRMVVKSWTSYKDNSDYVCTRCFKALKRNRIIVPLLSFFIFIVLLFLAFRSHGVWKGIGIIGFILTLLIFAFNSNFLTEILGLFLKPVIGPYRVHFLGGGVLMSRFRKKEYQRIEAICSSLAKYLSQEYNISTTEAYGLFYDFDFATKVLKDESILSLPSDILLRRLYSEKEITDFISSISEKREFSKTLISEFGRDLYLPF